MPAAKTHQARKASRTAVHQRQAQPLDAPRADVYERVTASIVAALEAGTRPWMKPWSKTSDLAGSGLPLRANGTPYRGINVLLLWGAAADAGYTASTWMTYEQAAKVRKGERGSMMVFAGSLAKPEEGENGQDEERQRSRF